MERKDFEDNLRRIWNKKETRKKNLERIEWKSMAIVDEMKVQIEIFWMYEIDYYHYILIVCKSGWDKR